MDSKKLKFLFITPLLLILSTSYANWDNSPEDSLLNALQNVKTDHERASTQLELAIFHLEKRKANKALQYADDAEKIAKNLDDPELLANVLYRKGEAYYGVDKGLEAIDYFNEALQVKNGLDAVVQLSVYNMMGITYLVFDEGAKGIEYFDHALTLQDAANEISGTTYEFIYNNKGITYSAMGMLDSAMANHNYCLNIRLKAKDLYGIGQSYNNLGTAFFEAEVYDSALVYFEWGLFYRNRMESPPL
ncbi:MAG: tetratricopeptide repeat protein [Crocinitomix sp.]|nr:tetratricopeptide repeat protein [Crocinitomix sp.]